MTMKPAGFAGQFPHSVGRVTSREAPAVCCLCLCAGGVRSERDFLLVVPSDWLVGAEDVELGQCLLDAVGDGCLRKAGLRAESSPVTGWQVAVQLSPVWAGVHRGGQGLGDNYLPPQFWISSIFSDIEILTPASLVRSV